MVDPVLVNWDEIGKLLLEIWYYLSRFLIIFMVLLSITGAIIVILKFSFGLKWENISKFVKNNKALTDKFLTPNSPSEEDEKMKEKRRELRISASKLHLIQRTMLFLCLADILV